MGVVGTQNAARAAGTLPSSTDPSAGGFDKFERSNRAVRRFYQIKPQLEAFARVFTGDPKMYVLPTSGASCTNGKMIKMKVNAELGDELRHDAMLCDKRDARDMLRCPACLANENMLVPLFHEIGHVIYDSFEAIGEFQKKRAVEEAVAEAERYHVSGRRLEKVRERMEKDPPKTYVEAAARISPFLHPILNCLEDARVNELTMQARPGMRRMFASRTRAIFEEGIEQPDGSRVFWSEQPRNAQVITGLLAMASGYHYEEWFTDEVVVALQDERLRELVGLATKATSAATLYKLGFPILDRLRELGFCSTPDDPDEEEGVDGDVNPADPDDEDTGGDSDSTGDAGSGDPDDEDPAGDEGSDESDPDADTAASASDDDAGDDDAGNDAGDDDDADTGASADAGDDDDADDDADTGAVPEDGDGTAGDDETSTGGTDDDDAGDDDEREQAGMSAEEDGDEQGAGEESAAGGMPEDDDNPYDDLDDLDDLLGDEEGDEEGEGDEGAGEEEGEDDSEDTGEGGSASSGNSDGGSPEDVEQVLKALGGHDDDDEDHHHDPSGAHVENDPDIERAIRQEQDFDTASQAVHSVKVVEEPADGAYGYPGNGFQPHGQRPHTQTLTIEENVLQKSIGKMRLAFSENKKGSRDRNRRSGRVHGSALGRRIPVNDDRVFQKRTRPGRRDYHVVIGLDVSYSTNSRGRIQMIKTAAKAQAELLARTGVPFEVWAHSADISTTPGATQYGKMFGLVMHKVKGLRDPWDDRARARLDSLVPFQCNLDGHTMEFYRKCLEKSQATDKVLMYYTDGDMPYENYNEELEILKREIRTLTRQGVEVVGVGITNSDPEKHGLDTVRVDNIEDVAKVVAELHKRLS